MRRIAATNCLLAVMLVGTGPGLAEPAVRVGTALNHPTLSFDFAPTDSEAGTTFQLSCSGAYVFLAVESLSNSQMSVWLAAERNVTITVDDTEAYFHLDDIYPTWWGWGAALAYDPTRGSTDWLERLPAAGQAALWTPLLAFPLLSGDDTREEVSQFAAACDDERFGRQPTSTEAGALVPAPPPDDGERAAVYEQDIGRSLLHEQIVLPGKVNWHFDESASPSAIAITGAFPGGDIAVDLTVMPTADSNRGETYALAVVFRTGEHFDGGAISELRHVRVSPDEVGRIASAIAIGGDDFHDPDRWAQVGPSAWRVLVSEDELRLLAESEVLELATTYAAYRFGDIILELGDSGHAVFDEAMAAWGVTPGAN